MADLNSLAKNVFKALMSSGEVGIELHASCDKPGYKDLIVVQRGGESLSNADPIGSVWIESNHGKTTVATVEDQMEEIFKANNLSERDFWKNSIIVFDYI